MAHKLYIQWATEKYDKLLILYYLLLSIFWGASFVFTSQFLSVNLDYLFFFLKACRKESNTSDINAFWINLYIVPPCTAVLKKEMQFKCLSICNYQEKKKKKHEISILVIHIMHAFNQLSKVNTFVTNININL